MVEIRVAVEDAKRAHLLVRRMAGLFDRSTVSFDPFRNEVRVHSEWESRAVGQVLETVESWLAAAGVRSAELSVGNRSYTIGGGPPLAIPSGRTE